MLIRGNQRWATIRFLFALDLLLCAGAQAQTYPQNPTPYPQNPYQQNTNQSPNYPQPNPYKPGYNQPGYPQPGYPYNSRTNSPVPSVTLVSDPDSTSSTPANATPAAPKGGYQEPRLDPKPFDPEKTGLTPEQRSEIATQLAQAIRLVASKSSTPPIDLATKTLGIALTLDPDNRAAVISNLQFVKNSRFENIPPEPTTAAYAKDLLKTIQLLKEHSDDDSKKLRGYLLSLANEFDSSNEDLLYEEEMLRRGGGAPNWAGIVGTPATPAALAEKAVPKQVSLLCLMVTELDSGDMAGRATTLTATLAPTDNSKPARVMVAGSIGKDMLTSFQESERAIKAQGTALPTGGDITISFGLKYSQKDGPSAGAALGLLLMGISGQIQIDPQFAITGDMNVDGSIHAIGGVAAKIRGASKANCVRMGIPEENFSDLQDMAILQEFDTLCKAQIFTVKNLHEASLLAVKEPDANLTKAMAAFAELQEFCRKNPQGTSYSNPFIREKLAETLAAAPNHASALVMQQYIDRNFQKNFH